MKLFSTDNSGYEYFSEGKKQRSPGCCLGMAICWYRKFSLIDHDAITADEQAIQLMETEPSRFESIICHQSLGWMDETPVDDVGYESSVEHSILRVKNDITRLINFETIARQKLFTHLVLDYFGVPFELLLMTFDREHVMVICCRNNFFYFFDPNQGLFAYPKIPRGALAICNYLEAMENRQPEIYKDKYELFVFESDKL